MSPPRTGMYKLPRQKNQRVLFLISDSYLKLNISTDKFNNNRNGKI